MDVNKLKKLHEVDYQIRSCSICKYSIFKHGPYGNCKLHTYEHLKHTNSTRQLSIHKFGSCKDFDSAADLNLVTFVDDTWEEFIK